MSVGEINGYIWIYLDDSSLGSRLDSVNKFPVRSHANKAARRSSVALVGRDKRPELCVSQIAAAQDERGPVRAAVALHFDDAGAISRQDDAVPIERKNLPRSKRRQTVLFILPFERDFWLGRIGEHIPRRRRTPRTGS